MFFLQQRTGCFAYSDQNTSDIMSFMSLPTSTNPVKIPVNRPYHLGVRKALLYLILSHSVFGQLISVRHHLLPPWAETKPLLDSLYSFRCPQHVHGDLGEFAYY